MRKNLERRISYAGYEKQIPGIVYFMRRVLLIICGNRKGKGKMEILRTENLKKYYADEPLTKEDIRRLKAAQNR